MKRGSAGFTLIELLVVISIIGMLASIVLAATIQVRQKAYVGKEQADSHTIYTQIESARLSNNGTMLSIVNPGYTTGCDDCQFTDGALITTQPVAIASNNDNWVKLGFSGAPKDPWGRPYIFDQNEGDTSFASCTVHDIIYSAGANGLWESGPAMDDQLTPPLKVTLSLGDDYYFNIPFFNCNGIY